LAAFLSCNALAFLHGCIKGNVRPRKSKQHAKRQGSALQYDLTRQLFDQQVNSTPKQSGTRNAKQYNFYLGNGKIRTKGAYNIEQAGREQRSVF
jgi:hypothetical protein